MSFEATVVQLIDKVSELEERLRHLAPRVVDAPFNAGKAKVLTIDGGSIMATRPHVLVIPESGVLDDLDFIENGTDGKFILIGCARDGDTITVRNYLNTPGETGNIDMYGSGNDRVMTNTHDSIFLYYKEETGHWEEVSPTFLNGLVGVTVTEPVAEGDILQANGDGIFVNVPLPGSGATEFTELTDVPPSYTGEAGKFVAVNGTEDGLEFVSSPTGVDEFIELTDVPASYTGEAGKLVAVKGAEDGLEFVVAPTGVDQFVELIDVPASYTGEAGKFVAVSGMEDGLVFVVLATVATTGSYADLTGIPSTFAPSAHATSHQHGGGDEIATATPAANAIPKADGSGTLNDWIDALLLDTANFAIHKTGSPSITATFNLAGLSAARAYVLPNGSGTLPIVEGNNAFTGTQTFGNGTGGVTFGINGLGGSTRDFNWQSAGSTRFIWRVSGSESGSNAGADFEWHRRADDGSFLGYVMQVTRSNGNTTFGGAIQSPTIVTPTIASFANANHNHTNSAGGGTLTSAAISDFIEAAQDAALGSLVLIDSSEIDFTYTDGSNTATAALINNSIAYARLVNTAQYRWLGRVASGSGALSALTANDLATLINTITAAVVLPDLAVVPGTASDTAIVGGVLYADTTTTGNVGTGEDTLASYSIPANTLAVNGQSVWFEAGGNYVNNGNTKTIRVDIGGTDVFSSTGGPSTDWTLHGRITRLTSTTVRCKITFVTNAGQNAANSDATVTLSGAVTLTITGEATSNNDVTISSVIVGWDDVNT